MLRSLQKQTLKEKRHFKMKENAIYETTSFQFDGISAHLHGDIELNKESLGSQCDTYNHKIRRTKTTAAVRRRENANEEKKRTPHRKLKKFKKMLLQIVSQPLATVIPGCAL